MKKVVGLVLIIIMISGASAFADVNTLILEDAINTAVKNSRKLKIDDLNIQNAQKVSEQAQKDSDKIYITSVENEKWFVSDAQKDEAYVSGQRKIVELTPEQREYDWNAAVKTKVLDEKIIRIDINKTYYSLIKAQDEVKIKSASSNISAKELKSIEAKYKKGLVSKNDYALAQIAKKNADIQVKLAQRAQKRLVAKLYKQMGIGYQPNVKELIRDVNYTDLGEVTVDDAIKKALDNRLEVYTASENERLKQLEFDIIDKYYEDTDIEYKEALNNLEDAKLSLETTKADIEFEIRTALNNLQNMLDTIEINSAEVEKNEINYSVLKTKKKIGMATSLEVDQAKLNLDKANNVLDNSIIDYIITRVQFEAAQEIGPAIV